MNRRIASALFLVAIMVICSSLFYLYVTLRNEIDNVPSVYNKMQNDQQARYQEEEDRVLAINRSIYDEVLKKFEELGGNPSELSRYDNFRFMRGGETSNDFLNSIEHEELAVNYVSEPITNSEKENLINKEISELRDDFKFKTIIHLYASLMALLLYIISIIMLRNKSKTESS